MMLLQAHKRVCVNEEDSSQESYTHEVEAQMERTVGLKTCYKLQALAVFIQGHEGNLKNQR